MVDTEISRGENGWWVATHIATGVTSQGRSRPEAVKNLEVALTGYHGTGHPPTEEELRDVGVRPHISKPNPDRYGGYDKDKELEHAELPLDWEPRQVEDRESDGEAGNGKD